MILITPPKSFNDIDKEIFDAFIEKGKLHNERITYNTLKLLCEDFIDEFTCLMRLHMSHRRSLRIDIQDCNYALHAFATLRRPRVSYIDWEEDDNLECEKKLDSNDTFECDKKDNPMIVSDDESDCSEDMEVDENLDSEDEDDDKICHLQPNLPIPTPKSYYEMFPPHHDLEELIPANDVHDLIKSSLSKNYHEDLLIKKLVPETTRSAMIAYVMKKL